MRAFEIDALERKIQEQIYQKHGVVLAGISVYSVNSMDEETKMLYRSVSDIVMSFDNVLQMHGFYLDKETKTVRFDIIISFDEKDRKALFEEIVKMVSTMHPEYTFCPILDSDISD